jgi:hypothetical protein
MSGRRDTLGYELKRSWSMPGIRNERNEKSVNAVA